jgi:hypothetical protein
LAQLNPFHFSRVFKQAAGDDAATVRDPRAHVASAATDSRNILQPHRNRARLHESEPFCRGISAVGLGSYSSATPSSLSSIVKNEAGLLDESADYGQMGEKDKTQAVIELSALGRASISTL